MGARSGVAWCTALKCRTLHHPAAFTLAQKAIVSMVYTMHEILDKDSEWRDMMAVGRPGL